MPLTARSDGQVINETWFNEPKDAIEAIQDQNTLSLAGLSITFELFGDYSRESSMNGVLYYLVKQDITILSATMLCHTVGSAGSAQMDVKRKRAAGAFTTLFTTKPAIPYTAGDMANSDSGTGATAAVIDSTVDELLAGDILRLDLTSVQTNGKGLALSLVYKPTGT